MDGISVSKVFEYDYFAMESAPSLEVVTQALQVLYHGENSDGKEKASLWLGELQKSVNLFSTPPMSTYIS